MSFHVGLGLCVACAWKLNVRCHLAGSTTSSGQISDLVQASRAVLKMVIEQQCFTTKCSASSTLTGSKDYSSRSSVKGMSARN